MSNREKSRGRSNCLLAFTAALCSVVAPVGATPQAGHRSVPDGASAKILEARDRVALHPALVPTVVVGLEQGDNSFRHRTPGLAQGDLAPAMIDVDLNRNRRLAMYEGNSFTRPVRPAAGSRAGNERTHGEGSEGPEPAPVPDDGRGTASRLWLLVPGLLLLASFAVIAQRKYRERVTVSE